MIKLVCHKNSAAFTPTWAIPFATRQEAQAWLDAHVDPFYWFLYTIEDAD